MKKWQKVTIWIASILIVLVIGGLFAANYAVDKVLDSMVGMSVDDLLEDNEFVADELNNEETLNPDTADTSTPDTNIDEDIVKDLTIDQPVGTDQQGSSNIGEDNIKPTTPDSNNKLPEQSEKPEGDDSNSGYKADISVDKAKEVEKNITVAEKAKVVTTLMGSLSATEIAALQKLASGGMDREEKKAAKEILLEKLTEDQYNDLVAIAAKHGLSQGRTYAEVIDEE